MRNSYLQQIKTLISTQTGLRILDGDEDSFQQLIQQRIKALKLASESEYYQWLLNLSQAEQACEHQQLSLDLTTGETYFFRDYGQIDLLSQQILPELIARNRRERRLRIWSAGCATGEEPYSLAILLDELAEDLSDWQILILGTDINPQALDKARQGYYRQWSFRQISEQRRQRYFQFSQSKWLLNPAIRTKVTFQPFNLVSDAFPNSEICQMDLILCRNVFIYLEAGMVSQIATKMTESLVEGGYLMTGHGELYAHPLGQLRSRIFPYSIIYQKVSQQHQHVLQPQPQKPLAVPTLARHTPHLVPPKRKLPVPETQPLSPAEPQATIAQAWVYANQGQPEQALSCCEQLRKQNPLDHHPYYLSALLAQEQGKRDEAKALLKKVLYLAPYFISAYLELADIYSKEGNLPLTRKMWSTAQLLLEKLPKNTPVEMFGYSTAADILKFIEHRLQE